MRLMVDAERKPMTSEGNIRRFNAVTGSSKMLTCCTGWNPVEELDEKKQHQNGDPEVGHGDACRRYDADGLVKPASAPNRRHDAERQRPGECDDNRQECECCRDFYLTCERIDNRAVCVSRVAEVTAQGVLEPAPILHVQRIVESPSLS